MPTTGASTKPPTKNMEARLRRQAVVRGRQSNSAGVLGNPKRERVPFRGRCTTGFLKRVSESSPTGKIPRWEWNIFPDQRTRHSRKKAWSPN